jgi:hypothetical protein
VLKELLKQVEDLHDVEIQIEAEGEYPTKARTKVDDVAWWQNYGTEKIKPAYFVEKAERKNRSWLARLNRAMAAWFNGDEYDMEQAAMKIAYDINVAVNRIKTGRLKKSMRGKVVKK